MKPLYYLPSNFNDVEQDLIEVKTVLKNTRKKLNKGKRKRNTTTYK